MSGGGSGRFAQPVARSMRPAAHGHALLSILLAALLTASGGMALARWTALILLSEHQLGIQEVITLRLANALETGTLDAEADLGCSTSVDAVLSGTSVRFTCRQQPKAHMAEPSGGHHIQFMAQWTDRGGHDRRLTLQTYWRPLPRRH